MYVFVPGYYNGIGLYLDTGWILGRSELRLMGMNLLIQIEIDLLRLYKGRLDAVQMCLNFRWIRFRDADQYLVGRASLMQYF